MLEAELQDALDHPLRREILRSLKGGDRPLTSAELAVRLAPVSISQVSYHVQVLAGAGAVVAGGAEASGSLPFASEVSEKPQVIAVLQATERGDRQRRQAALAESGLRLQGPGR